MPLKQGNRRHTFHLLMVNLIFMIGITVMVRFQFGPKVGLQLGFELESVSVPTFQ